MKKILLLVVVLTLVAFVSGAMAQQKPKSPPGKAEARAAALGKFSGAIQKVDEAAKTIDVKLKTKEKEQTMTFAVGDATKITKAGKDVPFSDLKAGMLIGVEYKTEGDKNIASLIRISVPRPSKTAPTTAPPAASTTAPK